jgi:hypothetical protein
MTSLILPLGQKYCLTSDCGVQVQSRSSKTAITSSLDCRLHRLTKAPHSNVCSVYVNESPHSTKNRKASNCAHKKVYCSLQRCWAGTILPSLVYKEANLSTSQ